MGFADSDGVRIHFVDHGGRGRPLVLVHATGFHARVWDPYVPSLRDRFRVVAIDQRGHGDSDKPAAGYDWRNFARDVLSVCADMGLDEPCGVGHSSGATALILAEADRPGTFTRLVLMDPVTPPPALRTFFTGQNNPLAAVARRRRSFWDSREQMIDRLRDGTPMSTWREEFLRAYVEHGTSPTEDGRFQLKCPPEVEAQVYEHGGRHDGWERLWDLDCPTLLLVGEQSEIWGRPEQLQHDLRNGRVEVVPGRGHFFPMEDPDATLDRVVRFLQAGILPSSLYG